MTSGLLKFVSLTKTNLDGVVWLIAVALAGVSRSFSCLFDDALCKQQSANFMGFWEALSCSSAFPLADTTLLA
jgi:hypothetical protein